MAAASGITKNQARLSADALQPGRAWMPIYFLTTFLDAFLLFQVEPMLVKYLLPWFGGSSSVWTTSLLFFQLMLLGGYTYSHLVSRRLGSRNQARFHLLLILTSLFLIGATTLLWQSPITPGTAWKPADSASPVLHLLLLLTISIGLPYFVLSTTAPLLQSWFARSYRGVSAYRLYSLSNLASLLALISYPLVVEPRLSVRSQALIWSMLYATFCLGLVICAARLFWIAQKNETDEPDIASIDDAAHAHPTVTTYVLWILLAACASLMLLATTSQLTQDVAPIPFLWILPLALYLLSFVICFNNETWYDRRIFHSALGLAVVLGTIVLCNPYSGIVRQIVIFSALLFCVCMVCHGELVRLKPNAAQLTAFYLMVSIGGAAGGLFAAIIAPHIFSGYWEFQLSIWGSVLLLSFVLMRDSHSWIHQRIPLLTLFIFAGAILMPWLAGSVPGSSIRIYALAAIATLGLMTTVAFRKSETGVFRNPGALVQLAGLFGILALGKVLLATVHASVAGSLRTSRNFYGTLAILERDTTSSQWRYYAMRNGRIIDGRQYPEPDKRRQPTAYFGPGSGIGLMMLHDPHRAPTSSATYSYRVGVVGLGAGTIAAYGRSGDYIRYYEINPDVIKAATDPNGYFTFIADSPAKVDVISGDARLSMERELRDGHPQRFDVLTIDAFSGDAVPVHLITSEAIGIYLRQLKPDGVIAFQITNGYLDLRPVLRKLAQHYNLQCAWIHDVVDSRMLASSDWVLMSRSNQIFAQPDIAAHVRSLDAAREVRLWTDDYSKLFQILK